MKWLIGGVLILSQLGIGLLSYAGGLGGITAVKYCTPEQGAKTWCGNQSGSGNGYTCLHWHSPEEFCLDENAPLPSCCRATEKDSGYTGCACCRSVHGSQRIDVQKRGWYTHDRGMNGMEGMDHKSEVEYDIH